MSTYASVDDYEAAFGFVESVKASAIDNPSAMAIDRDRVWTELEHATGIINSYVGNRYDIATLLAALPMQLRAACLDIARYRLIKQRVSEDVRQRYEDAIEFLKAISMGYASIDGVAIADPVRTYETYMISPKRVFSHSMCL